MITKIILMAAALLLKTETQCPVVNQSDSEQEVGDLVNQLKTIVKTGRFPKGLRIRIQADLIRTEDANGASETYYEHWEFTAKGVYRVEQKDRELARQELREFDQKQLANMVLMSKFQTIGRSEDKGLVDQFAGTEFNLGDRSIDFIVDDKSIFYIGESCVGGNLSPEDSKRFARLYENLIKLTTKTRTGKSAEKKCDSPARGEVPQSW